MSNATEALRVCPREPTEQMLKTVTYRFAVTPRYVAEIWRCMYDAAPVLATAPAEPPKEVAALIERLREFAANYRRECAEMECTEEGIEVVDEAADALARLSAPEESEFGPVVLGEPDKLMWRHPAPNAAVPMVPSPHQSLTSGVAAPVPDKEK